MFIASSLPPGGEKPSGPNFIRDIIVRDLESNKFSGRVQNFDFDIADTPCERVLHGESKSFPELIFHLGWWVDQDGPSGELVIQNGDNIDELIRPQAGIYLTMRSSIRESLS